MEKKYYDSEADKSSDKKLTDFYTRWDNTPKEEKDRIIKSIKDLLEQIAQIDFTLLDEEQKRDLLEKVKWIHTAISDIELLLGHRIVVRSFAICENVKREAEKGNLQAKEAWEKLKDDYYKAKYEDLEDN